MRKIIYIFVSKTGQISSFFVTVANRHKEMTDPVLLDTYAPDRLISFDADVYDGYVNRGLSFSNWHVVEVAPIL